MLDISNAAAVAPSNPLDRLWSTIESQAVLPTDASSFFSKTDMKKVDGRRRFVRHYMRCKAIMLRAETTHAIYVKDCSRNGMGFLSPLQLFPLETVELQMNLERSYALEIVRCRRIQAGCFECGAVFMV